jgi:hypothetical protein
MLRQLLARRRQGLARRAWGRRVSWCEDEEGSREPVKAPRRPHGQGRVSRWRLVRPGHAKARRARVAVLNRRYFRPLTVARRYTAHQRTAACQQRVAIPSGAVPRGGGVCDSTRGQAVSHRWPRAPRTTRHSREALAYGGRGARGRTLPECCRLVGGVPRLVEALRARSPTGRRVRRWGSRRCRTHCRSRCRTLAEFPNRRPGPPGDLLTAGCEGCRPPLASF